MLLGFPELEDRSVELIATCCKQNLGVGPQLLVPLCACLPVPCLLAWTRLSCRRGYNSLGLQLLLLQQEDEAHPVHWCQGAQQDCSRRRKGEGSGCIALPAAGQSTSCVRSQQSHGIWQNLPHLPPPPRDPHLSGDCFALGTWGFQRTTGATTEAYFIPQTPISGLVV